MAEFWWRSALCTQVDRDLFFARIGAHGDEAKEVCRLCHVRVACLVDEIKHESQSEGIFGGFGRGSRRAMHAQVERGADAEEVVLRSIEREGRARAS